MVYRLLKTPDDEMDLYRMNKGCDIFLLESGDFRAYVAVPEGEEMDEGERYSLDVFAMNGGHVSFVPQNHSLSIPRELELSLAPEAMREFPDSN